METTGARNAVNNSEDFKVCLYFPILDAVITELQSRFDDKNLELMKDSNVVTLSLHISLKLIIYYQQWSHTN